MFLRSALVYIAFASLCVLALGLPNGEAEITYVPAALGNDEAPVTIVHRDAPKKTEHDAKAVTPTPSSTVSNKAKADKVDRAPSATPASVYLASADESQRQAIQQMQAASDAQNAALHPATHPPGLGESADIRPSSESSLLEQEAESEADMDADAEDAEFDPYINTEEISAAVNQAFAVAGNEEREREFEESEATPADEDAYVADPSALVESEGEQQEQVEEEGAQKAEEETATENEDEDEEDEGEGQDEEDEPVFFEADNEQEDRSDEGEDQDETNEEYQPDE